MNSTTHDDLLAGIRAGWRATRAAAEEQRQREPPAGFAYLASENAEVGIRDTHPHQSNDEAAAAGKRDSENGGDLK